MLIADLADGSGNLTIYDRIWTAIAERKLRPGTRLKEENLADIFDVSRAKVRQALAALERDGLVTIQPNRGAAVAQPTIEEARDILFARRTVETRLVERLCATHTDAMIARLRAHVAEERSARQRGDTTAVIRLSGGFHMLLGDLAGSPYLAEVLRDLVSRTSLIVAMYQIPSHADCGPDEHAEVVARIGAGDVDGAKGAMEHHLGHLEARLDLDDDRSRDVDLRDIFG